MFAVPAPPPDSTTSGYSVPCTRNSTSDRQRPCRPTMSRTAPSNARMNSRPMILRLPSGLVTPDSASRNRVCDVDGDQVGAGGGDEVALHLRPLARPQQSVVDEHTRQPVADGALHQRGGHRRVHPAGQPADRAAVADLRAHLLDERVGDVGRRPCGADAGELVQEPAEHLLAVRGVHHLGVVLHAGQPARAVLERRDRRAGAGGHHLEPVRGRGDGVAVAHPHRLQCRADPNAVRRQSLSARCGRTRWCRCGRPCRPAPAPSPGSRSRCRTPARPRSNNAGIQLRGAVGVHAGRAAGQHDGLRVLGLDLLDGRGVRDDLREHPRLADPPGDQLRILRAEVDHQHRTGRGRRLRFHGVESSGG